MPFVKGDNRELVELSLLYLGDTSVSFKSFKKPRALHKARWMSKILCSIKIVLLSLHNTKAVGVNILNRNLEKNAHRNDESVSVHGAHFKLHCNFLPSYRIMLLLGHDQL